jgi:hypothetical protein
MRSQAQSINLAISEEKNMAKVFLSHATPDRWFVENVLLPLLQGHGVGTWYCQDDICAGEDFQKKIRAGMEECSFFLVVVSPCSVESSWVGYEVAWAVENRKGRVIPVRTAVGCLPEQMHLGLKPLHFVDFSTIGGEDCGHATVRTHRARLDLLKAFGIVDSGGQGSPSEEARFHERYLASRLQGSGGTAKLIDLLTQFAQKETGGPCVVQGPPGSGKAGLFAQFIDQYRKRFPAALVLPYFVDARPSARNLAALLRRFCSALAWYFGQPAYQPPYEIAPLKEDFSRLLQQAGALTAQGVLKSQVVLVIDALDRLDGADGAHALDWLPQELPKNIRVFLGCDCDVSTDRPLLPGLVQRVPLDTVRLNPKDAAAIRFEFVGYGAPVVLDKAVKDRLYMDVGGDLGVGVIDNHHLGSLGRSTTSVVLDHAHLVRDTVDSWSDPSRPFTFVLHHHPDLDCAAAAFLANAYLTTGRFPDGARALANYVDRVDAGHPGFSHAQPFTLYAAHQVLGHRLGKRSWPSPAACFEAWVRASWRVLAFVLDEMARQNQSIWNVDSFATPGVMSADDRAEVRADRDRYYKKLTDPKTKARHGTLRLPGQFGGSVEAETLMVRAVLDPGDPERCIYLKDWARTDTKYAKNGTGFVGLSVFVPAGPNIVQRCILSVNPASNASLEGLGALLEQAETERRLASFGKDQRLFDPNTGERLPDRIGYANPDPWYDGRNQAYTIVDSPRAGTVLSADEIEGVFLRFARRPSVY